MLVIPAIDILDGKAVRLLKGEYNSAKIYSDSPIEFVEKFTQFGFERIHIVDLSGAKEQKPMIIDLIKKIKSQSTVTIQSGGGVRTLDDALHIKDNGVDYLVTGSIAVKNRDIFENIVNRIGAESIISASDSRDGLIATDGWQSTSSISLEEQMKYCISLGIKSFLVTDISRDGSLQGTNHALYLKLMKKIPDIFLIASGGVKDKADLDQLKQTEVPAVVVGKAYYENLITLEEMRDAR